MVSIAFRRISLVLALLFYSLEIMLIFLCIFRHRQLYAFFLWVSVISAVGRHIAPFP
jgi:hypothetical protein